jgi:hypothetical protein
VLYFRDSSGDAAFGLQAADPAASGKVLLSADKTVEVAKLAALLRRLVAPGPVRCGTRGQPGMRKPAEILPFGMLAIGLHILLMAEWPDQGAEAGGVGCAALVSLAGATPQIETMVV